ncbi:N-acetyl-gamma-glutamyl-phosphate reductase [candidate division WOR-1 bacterium RIFOXYA12_FULL_43_27]|uniref:N-acetyl-gamma-glutamyl-phosphate reductase n=1 Tax=candidate division WOR-1 bacterium RIFOXYC2_FULL_46_14 TaxID=1802587 RepID=A0A1F4U540_UNCSA|nr:MAG: N-acetyl-gamma-glutamyl-phosphate reductase [candidate division WOR-1 bacterium RIFOXYA12_FULL_43_27]OGC20646.1 MAG: N-acetyl-gamma-glutamyl-phosphate reductase [candidate division WOR-1 bacterium RIFOXYB2_FULL_46_45]OGC31617.1 MAG: N-acetyl-gamma-glutamyl-phosphate reductase [candidate division WOR-1 bacterium RIFOXYA2_FULL_46_56]OGC40021.1 MAG: N-acetyl-gamma-glutamyl-phosphate reductase [candidate division WOR-1 bacterium RIFOXYC2_FULL_46_14]
MIKIGIIGAGGYAGVNLLGILLRHSKAEVKWLMSEPAHQGKKISELYPHLNGICDLPCFVLDDLDKKLAEIDLVFLALPHGIAINYVPKIIKAGKKVVDLGADYRFHDEAVFKKWYGIEHSDKKVLDEAVFGLPELYKNEIKKARLIGNPGCYPTASILGLAPLVKNGLIDSSAIFVDAKSGVSGAGRGVNLKTHFCERNDGIMAYAVTNHRHMGEIGYQVIRISGDQSAKVTFVPHLMPMTRGILVTIYAKLRRTANGEQLTAKYKEFYKGQPFVRVVEHEPCTKYVVNSNYCDIGVAVNEENGSVIVMSAIDNLIKGAAGQAVQNMNLICGFDETEGLTGLAVYP